VLYRSLPLIEDYPRAEHWSAWSYTPGLKPTAGLAGRLHRMGVTHPWLTRAAEWTWQRLESGFDEDAHALAEVLEFLATVPDRSRADSVSAHVGDWLSDLRWFRADPADPTYGLTPLHFAASPDSPWLDLFDGAAISGHLDRLAQVSRPTAAGPSPGPHQEAPPRWSGLASRPYARSAPSRLTVGSDEPDSRPALPRSRRIHSGLPQP
jgi:hypothetical protein